MKLQELFEQEKVGNIPVHHKPIGKTNFSHRGKKIGSGVDAIVYEHPKDPQGVVKIIHLGENYKNNTIVDFINTCIEHAPNNPFFPRVKSAKIYKRSSGQWEAEWQYYQMIMTCEKLHELKKYPHFVPVLFNQIGISEEDIKGYLDPDHEDTFDISHSFAEMFKHPELVEEILSNSKNPKFNEAMQIMQSFAFRDERIDSLDMHLGNWMFRMTKYGPQLVLNDPVTL